MSIHQATPTTLAIETPRAFVPLLGDHRYKGAKGGRGSAKSHFFAECLIEDCVREHIRSACLREFQTSIKESVKQLLEDKIRKFRLESIFHITEKEIVGPNDSLIIFKGLRNHTASSIKSLEGFNRAWVEEAQTISQRSLDILYPTFRSGSQLSFSWNAFSKDDPVDKFFEENKGDPDFQLIEVTYRDNPWFPDELRRDMLRDKRRDPERYAHVWLGQYLTNSEARVFKNWEINGFDTPEKTTFYHGADWGFSVDPTVLVRCFLDESGTRLFIDREVYKVGCEIDHTPKLFDSLDPESPREARKWRIVADSARPETISYMRRNGYDKIVGAKKGKDSVKDGIEFLKNYDIIVHPRCKYTIDELSMYSYKVDKLTEQVLPELEDKKNHVIDSLRYAVEGIRRKKAKASYSTYSAHTQ